MLYKKRKYGAGEHRQASLFYKQPGVGAQIWPNSKQQAKQLEASICV